MWHRDSCCRPTTTVLRVPPLHHQPNRLEACPHWPCLRPNLSLLHLLSRIPFPFPPDTTIYSLPNLFPKGTYHLCMVNLFLSQGPSFSCNCKLRPWTFEPVFGLKPSRHSKPQTSATKSPFLSIRHQHTPGNSCDGVKIQEWRGELNQMRRWILSAMTVCTVP